MNVIKQQKAIGVVEFTPVIQIRGFDLPPHVAQSS